MRRSVLVIPLCLLLATVASCGVAPDDEAHDEIAALTTTTEVARVTTSDGATWRFLEAEPGELFLWAVLANGSNLPTDGEIDRLSYVDIYRRLTSAPVPRTLLDAQARADALADEEPTPDDSGLVNESGGEVKDGGVTAQISATDFQNLYCWGPGWDFEYCWPSFYGNPYVQRKTYSMHGHVAAVSTTVDFRMRYKKHWYSPWTTLVSAQALPGQVHYIQQHYFNYRRWRRWEVLNNGANLVRYSLVGQD